MFKSRKSIVLGLIAALAITASAVAYFSVTGTGDGSGTVTKAARSVALTHSIDEFTDLDQDQTITIYADNTGTSPVHSTIDTLTVNATGEGCASDSFSLGEITSTPKELPVTGDPQAIATAEVTFHNRDSLQDNCVPHFDFTSK